MRDLSHADVGLASIALAASMSWSIRFRRASSGTPDFRKRFLAGVAALDRVAPLVVGDATTLTLVEIDSGSYRYATQPRQRDPRTCRTFRCINLPAL
jgi:hypothetical protein